MKSKIFLVALLATLTAGLKATAQTSAGKNTTVQAVTFKKDNLNLAGNVYLPAGFDKNKKYPAIVVVHPGGGVKEQTAGLYAQQLAENGFVALAFDASHQGASEGLPRFLDNPMNRVGDIYSAVDYLVTLPYVDAACIGGMGICAGSGTTVKAAMTERRIKALATVSAVDVGAATRKGWDGKASAAEQIAILEAVAKQRTAEATGTAPVYVPYVPEVGDKTAPLDLQEAADYYRTSRGGHPNSQNKMLLTSLPYLVSFNGFDGADQLLTQPLLLIAGSEAGSLWHSQELITKAASKDKELFIIKGATHMDLYDGKQYVPQVTKKLTGFFAKNL
ncbi:alpha/beta hydrolase [Chitinophagaceae bacterium LB-8]|uniref:Alpha/beta hydrolase n=1 Tax=Paraflavisolibacter caeni TaxID=2982496 RepID=A0A9X2XMQ6_9BACT|nr:alpha/beta hydrolase [Paraflavisolibacter caeni]MCU7547573.1 alpha/beta hydrolase [Paraflavisolibacter caeni]